MYPTHVLVLLFLELRKLASVLVDGWMATIRSQSVSSSGSPAGTGPITLHFFKKSVSLFSATVCNTPSVNLFRKEKEERREQGASAGGEGEEWRRGEEEGEAESSRTEPREDSFHR